ncbi:MAG: hypothetical protein LUG89_04895 [Methanosphaera sp.]|nr:hypothetical protein [Methanosphaera sp.]
MNDIVGGQKMMMSGSLMPSDDSANVAYAKVYVTDISGDIDDALWVDTINMTA